jgi:hypothetical protein
MAVSWFFIACGSGWNWKIHTGVEDMGPGGEIHGRNGEDDGG